MYIDNPVVMSAGEDDKSFVIFGEPKYLDFNSKMTEEKAQEVIQEKKEEEKIEEIKEENEEEDGELELGDLKEEDVENLMSYTNCSRNKAIKALRQSKGDLVEAITLLN